MTWNPGASVPLPPPAPLSYAPVSYAPSLPPDYGQNRIAILLSWLVIIGVVAFVGIENWRSSHDPRAERAVNTVELELTSRPLVGYVALIRHLGMGKQLEQKLSEMTKALTTPNESVETSLRTVPVIGELQGKAAALAKLDLIESRLKDVSEADEGVELRKDERSLRAIYSKSPAELSPQDRTRLRARLGWFGRLALVSGLPDSNPARQAILRASMRAIIAALSVEFFLLGLLIAGVVLMIIAIVKLSNGTLKLNYIPAPYAGSAFIEMFALYLAGFVSIGRLARAMHLHSMLAVYGIVSVWIVACCLWPLFRGLSISQIRVGLGWSTGRGILTEAAMGLVGYLTFMPMMALAIAATALLTHFGHEHAVHPIVFEAGGKSLSAMIGLYLLASGFAPVVEETMFRGALFHHMRRRHRWLLSAALTALIFAAIHPQGWTAIPVLGGIGFAFAGIREWRGNIIASGTAHAMNNAVAVTMMFLILG